MGDHDADRSQYPCSVWLPSDRGYAVLGLAFMSAAGEPRFTRRRHPAAFSAPRVLKATLGSGDEKWDLGAEMGPFPSAVYASFQAGSKPTSAVEHQ